MPWYAFFLAPFALIFRVVTGIRNFLYDKKILKSYRSPVTSLVVGNLSVGGTGKTPMVEFLIENFRKDLRIASLSRGYGRKTKGFIQANEKSTPKQIGDEPFQIFKKFKEEIPVFVGEDRVVALNRINKGNPGLDLVILDDAFQHRKLDADFYCLLTSFQSLFFKDYLLPMGRLRESRNGAKRADAVVVTKCPDKLTQELKEKICREIRNYSFERTPVFFSKIGYGMPYQLGGRKWPFSGTVILLSGLAREEEFLTFSRSKFKVLENLNFPDHYFYQQKDIQILKELLLQHQSENPVVLTTEKDAEKVKSVAGPEFLEEFPIFVLPIESKFEPQDQEMLLNYISEKLEIK
jgi:tetraacyldisaccharide 4'-kinase